MGLNLDRVYAKLGEATEKVGDDIQNQLDTMDTSSTTDMLLLQKLMGDWTIALQTQSNTTKTIQDGIKTVSQNMR